MSTEQSENTNKLDKSSNEEKTEVNKEVASKPPVDKKSLIIRGLIVLGIIYFFVNEYLNKEKPQEKIKTVSTRFKKQDKKNIISKVDAPLIKNNEQSASSSENKISVATDKPPSIDTMSPPVEDIVISKKVKDEPIANPSESVPVVPEVEVDKKIDQLIEKEEKKDVSQELAIPSVPAKQEEKNIKSGERIEPKQVDEKMGETSIPNLTDKIKENENYTSPPAYDVQGRGLIYNCKDKFWACVSKTAYIQCNKNMKWNSDNSKASECAIVNVYNSNVDCGKVQNYNISSGQATPFCK